MGRAVCERHPRDALALIVEAADGSVRNWTFGQLLAASSRLANSPAARGVGQGGRGGVVLRQFPLFGEEALEYRLANAEASALITDMSQLPKVLAVRERLPHLK